MRKIIAALMFVSCSASSADFAARVVEGNRAIASPAGRIYDAALGPIIQAAMVACVPPGSAPLGRLGKFTLVGYTGASGHLSSVMVEPITVVSRCFAAKLRSATLPSPPQSSRAYPITVEMAVTE
jgi:hypothetical protein